MHIRRDQYFLCDTCLVWRYMDAPAALRSMGVSDDASFVALVPKPMADEAKDTPWMQMLGIHHVDRYDLDTGQTVLIGYDA